MEYKCYGEKIKSRDGEVKWECQVQKGGGVALQS